MHFMTKLAPEELASPHILATLNDEAYCRATPGKMQQRYPVSKHACTAYVPDRV
jgi:hypothetical protein